LHATYYYQELLPLQPDYICWTNFHFDLTLITRIYSLITGNDCIFHKKEEWYVLWNQNKLMFLCLAWKSGTVVALPHTKIFACPHANEVRNLIFVWILFNGAWGLSALHESLSWHMRVKIVEVETKGSTLEPRENWSSTW
jgi:hypothetical protein